MKSMRVMFFFLGRKMFLEICVFTLNPISPQWFSSPPQTFAPFVPLSLQISPRGSKTINHVEPNFYFYVMIVFGVLREVLFLIINYAWDTVDESGYILGESWVFLNHQTVSLKIIPP